MTKYLLTISTIISIFQPLPAIEIEPANLNQVSSAMPEKTVIMPTTAANYSDIPTVTPAPTPILIGPNKNILSVWITAYSSSHDETDDTPLITASGKLVRDGVIAVNFLPFGTQIKIPKIFGEKIFTVEDRMHKRKKHFIDIWMPNKESAQKFGIKLTEIVVLN